MDYFICDGCKEVVCTNEYGTPFCVEHGIMQQVTYDEAYTKMLHWIAEDDDTTAQTNPN